MEDQKELFYESDVSMIYNTLFGFIENTIGKDIPKSLFHLKQALGCALTEEQYNFLERKYNKDDKK